MNRLSPFNILLFIFLVSKGSTEDLKIGLLFIANITEYEVLVGYHTSAAAVLIARDRIVRDQILPGYNITFSYGFDECKEELAAGLTIKMMRDLKLDAVIGPTCSNTAAISCTLGSLYNIPVWSWGMSTSASLDDLSRYPTLGLLSVSTYSLGVALKAALVQFKWTEFAFVYSKVMDTEKCFDMKNDIQDAVSEDNSVTLTMTTEIQDISSAGMAAVMKEVAKRARVIVFCFVEGKGLKRRFMLTMKDLGFTNDEFVYIIADPKARGFIQTYAGGVERYIWQSSDVVNSDGRDEEAKEAFKNVLCLSDLASKIQSNLTDNETEFSRQVIARMKEEPFNCTKECEDPQYSSASLFAYQLYDSMMSYAYSLNATLTTNPKDKRNGRAIIANIPTDIPGLYGPIRIDSNGTRLPTFYFSGINGSGFPTQFATIETQGHTATFHPQYASESELWANRHNHKRPLAVPECGFTGNECPIEFIDAYLVWIIMAGVIFVLALLAAVMGIFLTIRQRRREMERLNGMWKISFTDLSEIKKTNTNPSFRSISSGPSSTGTRVTQDTRTETRNHRFYMYDDEKIVATKHSMKPRLYESDESDLRKLRGIESDNLNRFMGLCFDAPEMLSVWSLPGPTHTIPRLGNQKVSGNMIVNFESSLLSTDESLAAKGPFIIIYCGRGSLKDVVQKGTITMDYFIAYSLAKDIVNGLHYLHKSFVKHHGHLTSTNCLVDDRFQVKLSNFGLRTLRISDKVETEDQLWTAPEILRGDVLDGSQSGDIYSYAIICSELVTQQPAWDLDNRKESPEKILYHLKKANGSAMRPELHVHESIEINPGMLELIRDCWHQDPERRPTIDQVKNLLRGMRPGKNDNLMDHVFSIMETYAATLEDEVTMRTKELVEEKKKCDLLLYRMLPRQVADKLKIGESVKPESFDSVTIFFSDVVSFTTLAGRCSPMQVVTLLNDLYSTFDAIIEQHDVYKVETIGDGYLCVSGLPHRNGNEHAKEIANMSLGFLNSLATFRISHLPNERINIRVGMHTGSVVAGVVGLTMPRYCLFGDTVNTASRMESNGKPGQIHVSSDANHMLTKVIGGFHTESRGDVIIKGKGVMETFWLLNRDSDGIVPKPAIKRFDHEIIRKETGDSEQRSVSPRNEGVYTTYKNQSDVIFMK